MTVEEQENFIGVVKAMGAGDGRNPLARVCPFAEFLRNGLNKYCQFPPFLSPLPPSPPPPREYLRSGSARLCFFFFITLTRRVE